MATMATPRHSVRDRTDEFFSTARSLGQQHTLQNSGAAPGDAASVSALQQRRSASRSEAPLVSAASATATNALAISMPALQQQSTLKQSSEFSRAAAQIGRGIHATTAKLQKLTQLAKRKSLFNDSSAEIQELTVLIKQDITQLNLDLEQLESFSQQRSSIAHANRQTSVHSGAVVATLKTQLAATTKNFSQVLKVRTENLRAQENRRQKFTSSGSKKAEGFGGRGGGGGNSLQMTPTTVLTSQRSTGSDMDHSRSSGHQHQGQQLQIVQQHSVVESQHEAVRNVERTIIELGEIYSKFSTIVSMHDELCVRIDTNMSEAVDNMNRGHSELTKYANSISQNRWLIIKIFFVLLLFIIFFVVFMG